MQKPYAHANLKKLRASSVNNCIIMQFFKCMLTSKSSMLKTNKIYFLFFFQVKISIPPCLFCAIWALADWRVLIYAMKS